MKIVIGPDGTRYTNINLEGYDPTPGTLLFHYSGFGHGYGDGRTPVCPIQAENCEALGKRLDRFFTSTHEQVLDLRSDPLAEPPADVARRVVASAPQPKPVIPDDVEIFDNPFVD